MNIQGLNNYSNRPTSSKLNEKSFDEFGQFKGTSWNKTAYVKNDINQTVVFEPNKDMTINLNSRYKVGGEAVYENLDRKHTGISFDLLDKFIEAAKDGILEDVDHKGYTKENMTNFGIAFAKLHNANKYTKMNDKTQFTFTAEELKTLYEAAGFRLATQKEDIEAETKTIAEEQLSVEVTKNTEVAVTEEHQNEEITSKATNVTPTFPETVVKGDDSATTTNKEALQKGRDNNAQSAPSMEQKNNEKLRYKTDKDGNLYVKKSGFFNRIFTRFQKVTTSNDGTTAYKEETMLDKAIKLVESGEDFIVPACAYYDTDGNMVQTNFAKLVKLSNGSYAFKDISYMGKFNNIYYEVDKKIIIGDKEPRLVTGKKLENVEEAK